MPTTTPAPALPATMTGVYLPGDATAALRELPVPRPGPGQVLLEIGASGICGSDIGYIYRGHKGHRGEEGSAYKGVVAGHEPAGRIVAVGEGVRRFGVGDRVLQYHIVGCGRCTACRAGYFISCAASSRAAYGWQRDGGHAPWMLAEESTTIALPDELSMVDGALIACGVGTVYEGLSRIAVDGRDQLVVVGLGPVGLLAALVARGMGVRTVIGVEPSAPRRTFAAGTDLFDDVVDPTEAAAHVAAATDGRGASASIDCSGATAGRSVAVDVAAEWGRVSLVGEGGRLETEVSDALLHKHLTLHASWVTSLQGMEAVTRHLVAWGLRPSRIVSDQHPLAEADRAYRLAAGDSAGKVCLLGAAE